MRHTTYCSFTVVNQKLKKYSVFRSRHKNPLKRHITCGIKFYVRSPIFAKVSVFRIHAVRYHSIIALLVNKFLVSYSYFIFLNYIATAIRWVGLVSLGQTAFFRFSLWWRYHKEKRKKAVWSRETRVGYGYIVIIVISSEQAPSGSPSQHNINLVSH